MDKTYAETNKGKMTKYMVKRGRHMRQERMPNGTIEYVMYETGMSIMMLPSDAARYDNIGLSELGGSDKVEIKTTVKVPDDWEDMRKADMLALAASIANAPVSTTKAAVEIIKAYLEKSDGSDSTDAS